MQLDYNLIRNILLNLEDLSDGYRNFPWRTLYEHDNTIQTVYSETVFRYHVKYLYDAGYIQADAQFYNTLDLTPLGRDYLNNVRDKSIWQTTQKHFAKLGNITLSLVSEIAKTYILKELNLKD